MVLARDVVEEDKSSLWDCGEKWRGHHVMSEAVMPRIILTSHSEESGVLINRVLAVCWLYGPREGNARWDGSRYRTIDELYHSLGICLEYLCAISHISTLWTEVPSSLAHLKSVGDLEQRPCC